MVRLAVWFSAPHTHTYTHTAAARPPIHPSGPSPFILPSTHSLPYPHLRHQHPHPRFPLHLALAPCPPLPPVYPIPVPPLPSPSLPCSTLPDPSWRCLTPTVALFHHTPSRSCLSASIKSAAFSISSSPPTLVRSAALQSGVGAAAGPSKVRRGKKWCFQ